VENGKGVIRVILDDVVFDRAALRPALRARLYVDVGHGVSSLNGVVPFFVELLRAGVAGLGGYAALELSSTRISWMSRWTPPAIQAVGPATSVSMVSATP
jgi:hypothetical protein